MGSFSSKDRTSIRVVRVHETTLEVQGTRLSPKKKGYRQSPAAVTSTQSNKVIAEGRAIESLTVDVRTQECKNEQ